MEHRLNCSSISHDGSLVVGGFSDSSVKVSSYRSKDHIFFAMLYVFFVGKISLVFTRFGICQRLVNQQKHVSQPFLFMGNHSILYYRFTVLAVLNTCIICI